MNKPILPYPIDFIVLDHVAQAQSEAAIRHSLRLLRMPIYPADFTPPQSKTIVIPRTGPDGLPR